jgi:hypothetical protein
MFFLVILSLLPFFSNADHLEPYLLPENHACHSRLKDIFRETKEELTEQTIKPLGFKTLEKLGAHVIVAKHEQCPGYVFKFYRYDVYKEPDWEHWIQRIQGARLIKEGINKFNYKHIFKVPKKWLFKTESMQTIKGEQYPAYILVAEDMRPQNPSKNADCWRQLTTQEDLDALHKMLKTYGLRDSARISNVPRCKCGKIAFIDTEYYQHWPVNYHPLLEFLSKKNTKYWIKIVTKDGTRLSAY